jgi:hypothetical protein
VYIGDDNDGIDVACQTLSSMMCIIGVIIYDISSLSAIL